MVRVFVEFFSRSYTQLETLQKQTLADFRTKVLDVAGKWSASIRRMPFTALHEEAFLDRVKRSAVYFADSIKKLFDKPIRLTQGVRSNNKQAMTRLDNEFVELRQTIRAKTILLRRIAEEGFSSTIYLKEKQMALLDAMDDGSSSASGKKTTRERMKKDKKPPKEKTWNISLKLFQQGKNLRQIAKERELTVSTIVGHLARFIPQGIVKIDDLMTPAHQNAIQKVIGIVGKSDGSGAIKALCPPDVEYWEIKLMLDYS
jgi:uncharacterized protein YpbB